MNDAGYKRWSSTEWWHENYDQLWSDINQNADSVTNTSTGGLVVAADAPSASHSDGDAVAKDKNKTTSTFRSRAPQTSVVYLTADSPEVLEELKEGETYIIGGICDHNRYKVHRPDLVF
jgi:tRNA (guanine9-N1)-methyltransferase